MIALAFSILFAVAFGHVTKWATYVKANLLWVAACNYLSASLTCALLMFFVRPGQHVLFTALTGAWGGVCYLLSLILYFSAVNRLGMGLATSANRIAVAMPVAFALLFWHETIHADQLIGLCLVAVSIPLLGGGVRGPQSNQMQLLLGTLLPLFVITGAGQVANRVYSSGAPSQNVFLFLAALFGAAGISALMAILIRPVRLRKQDVQIGVVLGGVNLIANVLLLAALRDLPSAVVFSVSGAASVVLATATGVLFWRERLNRSAASGIGLATFAVVLLTR